jgi:hypothetical protein
MLVRREVRLKLEFLDAVKNRLWYGPLGVGDPSFWVLVVNNKSDFIDLQIRSLEIRICSYY